MSINLMRFKLQDFSAKQDQQMKIKDNFVVNAKFMTHSESNQTQWNKI